MSSNPLLVARRILHDPARAAGGDSGETFTGLWFREPAYLRVYLSDPDRAVVDLALLRRLSGVVPVPRVLAAEPRSVGGLPPHVVTAAAAGQRADLALGRGLPVHAAGALGRQCARLVTRLRSVGCDRPGPLLDADLRAGHWPPQRHTIQAWYEHHEPHLAAAGLGRRALPGLRALVRSASDGLAMADRRPAALVHGDLAARNLLLDPDTGRLHAVVDWERAHAGDWAEDVGRLLRDADAGAAAGGAGAASWTAFRRGLVDALHAAIHEGGRPSTTSAAEEDWLRRAVDLDLFGLIELSARPEQGAAAPPSVELARQALRARVHDRGPR